MYAAVYYTLLKSEYVMYSKGLELCKYFPDGLNTPQLNDPLRFLAAQESLIAINLLIGAGKFGDQVD